MKILIVDDEKIQRELLQGFLVKKGYEVRTAADGNEALRTFSEDSISLVLLDHKMPGLTGDEVLEKMKEINPFIKAIMITAYATVDTAVRVMKLGADDFLEKPVDLLKLLDKIQLIEQALMISSEAEELIENIDTNNLPVKIIGKSKALKEVLSLASRIALTEWTVMVRGETGTGKEMFAHLIHLLSPRSNNPFIEVNCAAVPENLFESELFGHEKGAFTGAIATRRGRFELADKGTLFLDEIGELPLNLQAKLLKALQEKRITRVGSEKETGVDARVIAATNRDLKQMVREGTFREDLYFRLNVLDVEIPPLRKRKEDIPELAFFFLEKFSARPVSFDKDAMDMLVKYSFPGNIRELEHTIQRTVTFCRSSLIREKDLPPEIRFYRATQQGTLSEKLESLEKELIVTALENSEWVQTRAAEELGISERVLRYKIKKHNLKSQQ